jgi:hypothetical protein
MKYEIPASSAMAPIAIAITPPPLRPPPLVEEVVVGLTIDVDVDAAVVV